MDKANTLLESLPERNLNEISFKEVQRINLKRFNHAVNAYMMTASEDHNLRTIALSNVPSSGYARSLYYILTGINLPINLPPSDSREQVRSGEDNTIPTILIISQSSKRYCKDIGIGRTDNSQYQDSNSRREFNF